MSVPAARRNSRYRWNRSLLSCMIWVWIVAGMGFCYMSARRETEVLYDGRGQIEVLALD